MRLDDLAEDPRSVGFPPNHPPMRSFLGVPILLRGVAYGNLYLTEKADGAPFTDEDEELTTLLSSQAAVAIENARLYEAATRWLNQLESLNEISNALASEVDLSRLLDLIAARLRELMHARIVLIALPVPDGSLIIRATDGDGSDELRGVRLERERSKTGRVLERRRSERVDSLIDDIEMDQEAGRKMGARTGVFVPMMLRDRAIGVISAHDKEGADVRFTDEDVRLAEAFAARAAVAVDLSERVASDALRRVVSAQELERQRLARELHDETGQALTSILLKLKSFEDIGDPARLAEATGELRELVVATLQDVRRLAVELRPKALDDFGLVPAIERLVGTFREQTGIEVDLESRLGSDRLPREIETTLYRITQEALTNVVKHAQAKHVSIVLTRRDGSVAAVIEDDGRGITEAGRRRTRPARNARAHRARRRAARGRILARFGNHALGRGSGRVTIRVLVVDDHAVVRSGLRHVLEAEDDIEVVAEAGDLREAVFEARAHKPDVILMDVVMPGASGIEATPAVLKEAKDAKVLMLSMQDDPRYVREAFSVGASGYVLKEAADAEVVDAVREVANGGRYVHPALGARLVQAEAQERAQAEEDPLSEREREVLRLLALGHTNQEIAKMLYLSVRTVETHRAHIMQKLRLTTRAELVRYAIDQGLLEEPAE